MSEADRQETQKGKFNSARDEALYRMTLTGWANQSSGDQASPTGFFARISIYPNELAEIIEAFEDELREVGSPEPRDLLGDFTLHEDDLGFVTVIKHDDETSAQAAYDELNAAYEAWLSTPEDGLTPPQRATLENLCGRYGVEFNASDYLPAWDLPDGYVAGWIGGLAIQAEHPTIYVGVSAEGEASS